jgi:hypothetical protein
MLQNFFLSLFTSVKVVGELFTLGQSPLLLIENLKRNGISKCNKNSTHNVWRFVIACITAATRVVLD